MKQLGLFDRLAVSSPPPPGWPDEEPVEANAPQLGLFSARHEHLALVGSAVADGRLDEAVAGLQSLCARWPEDRDLREMLSTASAIAGEIAQVEARGADEQAAAFLDVAEELRDTAGPWARLRQHLLARVATSLRAASCSELAGEPAGYYLLAAGMPAAARASLETAASRGRHAHVLFLLADACATLRLPAARSLYLEALLLDPFDQALATAVDPVVRELPELADDEFELDPPAAWAAPVGLVAGVLPRPTIDMVAALLAHPAATAALTSARRFVQAFVQAEEGAADVVEARRTMKQLAPSLFERYLRRPR